MKYYQVISNKLNIAFYDRNEKRTYYTKDNIFSYRYKNGLKFSYQYIADELITAAELKKYFGITSENITRFPFLQPVEINKNKTHFAFGARFADDHAIYFDENGEKIK
jgi:hypothetical protein